MRLASSTIIQAPHKPTWRCFLLLSIYSCCGIVLIGCTSTTSGSLPSPTATPIATVAAPVQAVAPIAASTTPAPLRLNQPYAQNDTLVTVTRFDDDVDPRHEPDLCGDWQVKPRLFNWVRLVVIEENRGNLPAFVSISLQQPGVGLPATVINGINTSGGSLVVDSELIHANLIPAHRAIERRIYFLLPGIQGEAAVRIGNNLVTPSLTPTPLAVPVADASLFTILLPDPATLPDYYTEVGGSARGSTDCHV